MTKYTFGSSLKRPTTFSRRLVGNGKVFISTLTGAMQTAVRPGERWEITAEWVNLHGDERADILAFFMRLNGTEHRVRIPEFNYTRRGAGGGSPIVNGTGQTGSTININGADASVTNWLRAGDFVVFDDHARMVTADVDTNGSGFATIPVMPKIRTSPANNATVFIEENLMYSDCILVSPVEYDNRDILAAGGNVSNLSLTFLDDVSA